MLDVGIVSMLGTALMLAASTVLSVTGIGHVAPPPILDSERTSISAPAVALLALIIAAAFQLFGRIRRQTSQLHTETSRAREAAERAHAAAEREGNAAAIAGTLMVVIDAVSRLTRLDEVLNTVVEVLPRVLDIDYCGVLSWDDMRSRYEGSAIAGVDSTMKEAFLRVSLTPEEAPDLEWVRRLEQCALVPSLPQTPLDPDAVPTMLLAPLHSSGRFFGVLLFARRSSSTTFTERDFTITDGVAAQIAVALERTRSSRTAAAWCRRSTAPGSASSHRRERRVVYVNPSFLRTLGFSERRSSGATP